VSVKVHALVPEAEGNIRGVAGSWQSLRSPVVHGRIV